LFSTNKEEIEMFKCEQCGKTSKPRTRQNRIIVETRPRNYYSIIIIHKIVKNPRFMQFKTKDQNILDNLQRAGWKVVHENFSKGNEIVREKIICEDCNNEIPQK